MKNLTILLCGFFASTVALAQNGATSMNVHGPSVGFSINQFQQDFGLGLHATTPYVFHDRVAVRLSGNFQWLQNTNSDETRWYSYQTYKAGVVGIAGHIGQSIRLYGEGGITVIAPGSQISSKSTVIGGYGLFGFEFFVRPSLTYFLEFGGMGTEATADKLAGKPVYSNGFTISVGARGIF